MDIRFTFDASRPHAVGQLTLVGDMPSLVGSDKQIAWATDIRATAAREVAAEIAKVGGFTARYVLSTDADHIADAHAKIDAALATGSGPKVAAAIVKLFAQPSAKWWIENGRTDARVLIRNAM